MSKVLIFSGTTEGRELAAILAKSGIESHVCVATEYGERVMDEDELIHIECGRLDEEGMKKLYDSVGCSVVVDATHPYASLVSDTIKKSLADRDIEYLRLLRPEDGSHGAKVYADVDACADALRKTEGNILLTTGSKELDHFWKYEDLKERLYVRVLPGEESIKICKDLGIDGKRIIAMQGPFSKEMNKAIIKEYDIEHLVSKNSGKPGGIEAKIAACEDCSVAMHLIDRPTEAEEGMSMKAVIDRLETILGREIKRGNLFVTLGGIGPGGSGYMTEEIKDAVKEADYIFAAPRMLESISSAATMYPYYLKEDIIPVLEKIGEENCGNVNIVILFSGDTGFYSGSKKMGEALKEMEGVEVRTLPGISSVSLLASRASESWDDASILSLHGTDIEDMMPVFCDSVKHKRKTFFITSGLKDIKAISELDIWKDQKDIEIIIGYRLSYPDEKIYRISDGNFDEIKDEGLYTGLVINRAPSGRTLTPSLRDEDMIRDSVPMTKQEIRRLTVCSMGLRENSVVYDIGSGTGSIAVQTALMSPTIEVYAIECKDEALELMAKNRDKFGVSNMHIVKAMAPEGLSELPPADVSFIGGSRGNLREIVKALYGINNKMRVVMNGVTMDSISSMNEIVKEYPATDIDIVQVGISRVTKLGNAEMLKSENPVFIFSFTFKEA